MAENSIAHLSAEAWEQVRLDQYDVDKRFWPEICAMQVFTDAVSLIASIGKASPPAPIMPKAPFKLFGILGRYANESFDCEYDKYPPTVKSEWGVKLIDKIEHFVMVRVAALDGVRSPGTEHHGSYEQMRSAVRKSLNRHFMDLMKANVATALLSPASSDHIPLIAAGPLELNPPPVSTVPVPPSVKNQLKALFNRSALEPGDAAKALGISKKSVYRHINGEANPRREHVVAYEVMFTADLKEPVKLIVPKRSRNSQQQPENVTEKSKDGK